jgi:hypothetical protein
MNGSACESASVVHVYSLTAIFKVPARRWLQATSVLLAEVISVRVSFGRQVVEPHK